MELYNNSGYELDAVKASTMLMHIYASSPEQLPALKSLIDRYDSESSLFDEHHELPQSKRQYYYYKGKYFECVGQLDSAEYYYRKVNRPGMKAISCVPMMEGLLGVFQKRHEADSIAKYAKLFCLYNDSSVAINDQEMTARLSASYQYGRYQQEAAVNAGKAADAKQKMTVLLNATLILVAIFVCFFIRAKEKQKKQREECNMAIAERTKLQSELKVLHARNYDALIAQKEEEISKLSQTIKKIVPAYQKMKERDAMSGFVNSDIVVAFAQKSGNPQLGVPTNMEWKGLEGEFEKNLPSVYEQMKILSPPSASSLYSPSA